MSHDRQLNPIAFMSSDARQLYQDDVYRALALPRGSTVHFRYRKKHLADNLLTKTKDLQGRRGIIYFVAGCDLSKPESEWNRKCFSICYVDILKIDESNHTGYIHFFLKLEGFCHRPLTGTFDNLVKEVAPQEGTLHTWSERINDVKSRLNHDLFVNYRVLKWDGQEVVPTWIEQARTSVLKLKDESRYVLEVSVIDKNEGKSCLKLSGGPSLHIHGKDESPLGTIADDRRFALTTESIDRAGSESFIELTEATSGLKTFTFLQLRKKNLSTFFFGILSAAGLFGISAAQVFVESFKDTSRFWISGGALVVSLVIFGISGAFLYRGFNKK